MIKRVIKLYNIIVERLPSTYPTAKLVFYQDEECLLEYHSEIKKIDGESVYAIIDPNTNTIHLPLQMTFEYEIRDRVIKREVKISQVSDKELAHTILHEHAHLYFGKKYGYDSKQYDDEIKCDQFADRWIEKLVKEGIL